MNNKIQKTKTKIRVGDTVSVIKGKDQGKQGKVESIDLINKRILVENINLVKKHVKPRGKQQGGIITLNKSIAIANVQVICPSCSKRTKIKIEGTGKTKQRICKQCKAVIVIGENKKK